MTKKQTRFLIASLPVLAILAFLANADAILGSQAENPSVESAPAPAPEASATSSPAPSATEPQPTTSEEIRTIPESSLGFLQGNSQASRNPFLTAREQEASASSQTSEPTIEEAPPFEMPADLWVQGTIILRNGYKVATVADGRGSILREGDYFFGGKVVAIEKERVTVQFKSGERWFIPVGPPAPQPKEGSENEASKPK